MERDEPGDFSPRDRDDDVWRPSPAPDDRLSDDVGTGSVEGNGDETPASPDWWAYLADDIDDDEDDGPDPLASTAPLPLPPEDRLWRHPSEIRGLLTDEVVTPASSPSGASRSLAGAVVLAAVAGAVLTAAGIWLLVPQREIVTERVVERQLVEPATAFVNTSMNGVDVVGIAEAVKPSIVRLEILNRAGTIVGSGSGVIFRDDGHVLTNAHVIERASSVEVVLSDGRRLDAGIIGADPLTDVGVVKIDAPDPLPTILLGSTEQLRVGESAVAVGSPLRLAGGPTVTVGVVSAIGRTLDLPSGGRLYDLVQTDAPISPGSSGGALVDGSGALIGITTVVAVSEVGAEGLGFATPVEIAYDVASDIVVDGRVTHGFLGIGGDDLANEHAADLGVDGGAVITAVGDDTPASDAGLEVGDIIVAVNGKSVATMGELVVRIRRVEPGDVVDISMIRGGNSLTTSARIVERPDS